MVPTAGRIGVTLAGSGGRGRARDPVGTAGRRWRDPAEHQGDRDPDDQSGDAPHGRIPTRPGRRRAGRRLGDLHHPGPPAVEIGPEAGVGGTSVDLGQLLGDGRGLRPQTGEAGRDPRRVRPTRFAGRHRGQGVDLGRDLVVQPVEAVLEGAGLGLEGGNRGLLLVTGPLVGPVDVRRRHRIGDRSRLGSGRAGRANHQEIVGGRVDDHPRPQVGDGHRGGEAATGVVEHVVSGRQPDLGGNVAGRVPTAVGSRRREEYQGLGPVGGTGQETEAGPGGDPDRRQGDHHQPAPGDGPDHGGQIEGSLVERDVVDGDPPPADRHRARIGQNG